jgi:hypothetical protein
MTATDDKIEEGTRMVTQSLQMAYESETMGEDILNNLSTQRETIKRTQRNVGVVASELDDARGTIKNIEQNEKCSLM